VIAGAAANTSSNVRSTQSALSSTTAVPYATISLIVWPISAESNHHDCVHLHEFRVLHQTIHGVAACLFEQLRVLADLTRNKRAQPAMMLPPRPRLRTTTPNT